MAEKQQQTLGDYIVTALSPALIMGLVGSLVFFFAEIMYAGKYEGRLLWTLFFFVFGMVLVSRISIQVDRTRARAYGLILAVVSWIALMAFIRYPEDSSMSQFAGVINLFLMAIIWWCSDKLTWDCTFIDENRKASGKGLLAAAGMEARPETRGQARHDDLLVEDVTDTKEAKLSFFERWQKFRERRAKRPHTPGITVVWFSLAALPIFGLGQSLVPPNEHGRRNYTFWLAAAYVGSALGLLLTTSYLGIRRYLRQRKLKMPAAMTATWMGMGAVLVVAFILVGALLPRPFSETPIWNLQRVTSPDREASKNSMMSDSAGKGEGRAGRQTKAGDGRATSKGGKPGGKGGDGNSKEGSGDKQDANGNSGGDQKSSDGDSKGEKSGDSKDGEKSETEKSEGDKSETEKSDANKDGGKSSERQKGEKQGSKSSSRRSEQGSKSENGKEKGSSSSSDSRFPDTKLGHAMEKFVNVLKWLVFIALALLVLAFLFRNALKYFANFSPWARGLLASLSAWWNGLFSKKETKVQAVAEAPKPKRRPFTSYTNPFAGGDAESRSAAELIEYSFTALEAWAADRNHPRKQDETPLEFAARLTNMFPTLEGEPHKLSVLVVGLVYAKGSIPEDARATLEQFWEHMIHTMPVPAEAA